MKKYQPARSALWEKGYISYRRLWLDSCLEAFSGDMCGVVVDLGGKRVGKRGSFRPQEDKARAWWYLNLDMETGPNVFANVNHTPLVSQSVDCVVCTEVLEHIPAPKACVNEMVRLLRRGGIAFISVPFMYPIHADPFDFQRFTEEGLRVLFADFSEVEIIPMGGYPGTLGMLIEIGIDGIEGRAISRRITRWLLRWIARWMCWFDLYRNTDDNKVWNKYTTGYFVKAIK